MPNNLVFNNVASQLQTQISGQDNTGVVRKILTDTDGRLLIGEVTITATDLEIRPLSGATDSITIANAAVTVTATDFEIRQLSGATDSITIANAEITVTATDFEIRQLSGATDSITIANAEITVTATDFEIRQLSGATDSITIANAAVTVTATNFEIRPLSADTDSISLAGRLFTESNIAVNNVTDSGGIFAQNTGECSMYSFYVYNRGPNPLTVSLQISPVDDDDYYVFDGGAESSATIETDEKIVLVAEKYLKFTRLFYDTNGADCSFEVYYNAQI